MAVIDDVILEALVSDDIETRKQAVRDLARTRSREALNLLAELQRDDEDPEVRELARKGWSYIRKHLPEDKLDAKVRKTKGATAYAIHDPDQDDSDLALKTREQARDLFNEALDRHSRGDDRKAGDLLGKALKMNPALARDPYVISTAAAITGIDGTTAVERLLAEQRKPKSQPVAVPSQWREAVLDVGMYGLISAGGTFALFLIVSRLIWPEFESAIALNPALANSQSLLETFFNNTWSFVVFSSAAGFYFIYTLLVQNVFVHFAAVSLLGGRGKYPVLLSKTSVVGIATNIFIMVIIVGIFILLPEGFAPNLAQGISDLFICNNCSGQYDFSNNIAVLEATFTQLFNAISTLCCVGILGLLASNYFFSRAIGRTYRVGTARGFFALLLAGIIMQLVGQFIVNPVVNLVFSLVFQSV